MGNRFNCFQWGCIRVGSIMVWEHVWWVGCLMFWCWAMEGYGVCVGWGLTALASER